MNNFLDALEKLADKKYKVFIHDNQPIPCDEVEIREDWVYCRDFDYDTFLMIPTRQVKSIKVYEKRGGLNYGDNRSSIKQNRR